MNRIDSPSMPCLSLSIFANKLCYMNEKLVQRIAKEVEEIKASGLYKTERIIESPQGAEIVVNGKTVLNFCANNYLGLSSHPKVIEAAHKAIDHRGYGMSSVRFICGTQDIHKELEEKFRNSSARRTPYYMPPLLMPTAGCLNPCSTSRMQLFPMR